MDSPFMIKKSKLFDPQWFLVLLLSSLLIACDGKMNFGNDEDSESEDEKKEIAIPVKTGEVFEGSITAFYPSTTSLESEQEASVVAKVGGIVEKYYVEEGDLVEVGQPLVQLETDRLKFEFESKQAEYELAKLELTFATVTAPIGGVISKRYVKVGNMITINEPVYHITDFDPLHAIVYVPERELNKIALDQQVRVLVDARIGKLYQGFVKRISPIVDADSGTFKVTIEVSDPDNELKPGMFGRLQIIQAVHDKAMLIEKKAIITEDIVTSVFIVRDGRAFLQEVKTGFINNNQIEILSGLSLGDVIVTTGQNSLKDDSLIEILE